MKLFRRFISLAVVLAALAYLSGSDARSIRFAAIALLVLFPLAGICAAMLSGAKGLTPELRACLACVLALIIATPMYYLRRSIPLPTLYADAIVMAALVGLAIGVGGFRRLLSDLVAPGLRVAAPFVFVALPILMCLVWAGFEVKSETSVRYYGLTPVDYSNLANFGVLAKISPALPLDATAGLQPVGYHWYFFALPAWASELFSQKFAADARVADMLVLFNALSAAVLIVTVAAILPNVSRGAMMIAIAVALVAPMSSYAYQFAMKLVHFSIGERNSLMLSPLNSMTTFGNNTLAIAMALLACRLVLLWNERPSWSIAALVSLLATAMIGYSVTLAMPLALALFAWLVIGRIRRPIKLALVGLPIAAAGLFVLMRTQVLGASGESPALSFDGLRFARNVILGMAPIVALITIGLVAARQLSLYGILVLACVAVPTFIGLRESRSGESALSMKIASLLAVAGAPLAALGAQYLIDQRKTVLRLFVGLVCLAGFVNTAAYAGQFVAARTIGRGSRFVEIPRDYFNALRIAREATPWQAVVIDSNYLAMPQTIGTLLLAERRVWLPTPYSIESHQLAPRDPITQRLSQQNGFGDLQTARYLATAADVLIVRNGDGTPPSPWKLHAKSGEYAVYLSQLRAR